MNRGGKGPQCGMDQASWETEEPWSRGVLVDARVPVLVWVEHPLRGPEAELFCPCKSPAKGLESGWKSGVWLWWGD